MSTLIQVQRACLAASVVLFLWQASSPAMASNACAPDWREQAEKAAELGLQLLHSSRASDRVRLWRLIEMGEEAPSGGATEDLPGTWSGTWRDEKNAHEFLAAEAATRGVDWSFSRKRYSWPPYNMWFAAKLFEERRGVLGDQHPYLKRWLENQRAVFMKSSPDLVNASHQYDGLAAELATDDFQYQAAALLFYAQSYTSAADSFRMIAAQPSSRYRSIASYMVARSLTWARRFDEALAEISAIQDNPELSDVHTIAQQLIGLISWTGWWDGKTYSAHDEAARRLLLSNAQAMRLPLATLESDASQRALYWQAVNDLAFFLRSDGSRSWFRRQFDEDWWLDQSRTAISGTWSSGVARAAAEDELIDWLQSTEQVRVLASGPWLAFWSVRPSSSAFQAASSHASRRAEESGKLVWLIADAMRAPRSWKISSAVHQITGKLRDCSASRAELLALGALQYHLARAEALHDRPYRRYLPRTAQIERLENLTPEARREATRLVLALTGSVASLGGLKTGDSELDWLLSMSLNDFMAIPGQHHRDDGQIAVLNMLPARVLLKLAGDQTLPQELRATLVRVAWTRAYLLGDEAVLGPATELLVKLNPGLSEIAARYRAAWTERSRKGAALMLLVRAPSMQVVIPTSSDLFFGHRYGIRREGRPGRWSWYLTPAEATKESLGLFWADDWNHNDGNWWCRPHIMRLQARLERDFYDKPLALAYDATWYSHYDPVGHVAYSTSLRQELNDRRRDFLSTHPVLKMIDWEELARLSRIPAAPEYLTTGIVTWVKEASWFDRWLYGDEMAEALALAVRATRFGCHRDGSNRNHSYAAFRLLHEAFPESEAAKQTRYWYD